MNTPFQSAPVRNNPTPRTPNAEIKVAGEDGEGLLGAAELVGFLVEGGQARGQFLNAGPQVLGSAGDLAFAGVDSIQERR
ncbi:hypothetical protein [Streptomyces sp. R41]|uniref:Uncharacterized protein n=1 Tax=Streptomyces sp. R41 TaxID=3238632 RepID=A0AB39RQP8_9ACTN